MFGVRYVSNVVNVSWYFFERPLVASSQRDKLTADCDNITYVLAIRFFGGSETDITDIIRSSTRNGGIQEFKVLQRKIHTLNAILHVGTRN